MFHFPFCPTVKEHAMSVVERVASYRSPRHKLLGFFESSRDKWKDKCKAAKVRLKRATNRVESLVRSRDLWKERAREGEAEAARLRRLLEDQKALR